MLRECIGSPLYDQKSIESLVHKSADGRVFRVLAPADSIPEITRREYGVPDEEHLGRSFARYILNQHKTNLDSTASTTDIQSYLRIWNCFYSRVGGVDNLWGPWKDDALAFSGIRVHQRGKPRKPNTLEFNLRYLAVPFYDYQEVKEVAAMGRDGRNVLLKAEIGEEAVLCVLPHLLDAYTQTFLWEIEILSKNRRKKIPLPKLKGVIGFPKDKNDNNVSVIFGYVLDWIHGQSLDEADVSNELRAKWQTRLPDLYNKLQALRIPWRGAGPENLRVSELGELYFDRPRFRWTDDAQPEPSDDEAALSRVMSFLQREPQLAPKRYRGRESGSGLLDLPLEVHYEIYRYFLRIPDKIFWDFNYFRSLGKDNHLNGLSDCGLADVLPEARSYFYAENHFCVEFRYLDKFLSRVEKESSKFPKRITIQLNARAECYTGPCIHTIQRIVDKCPGLNQLELYIYGSECMYYSWWETHAVLKEIRSGCKQYVSGVDSSGFYDTSNTVRYDEVGKMVYKWLQSQ